jgi:magnesium transporter
MRVFHITEHAVSESAAPPQSAPESGFVWMACSRSEFEAELGLIQHALERLGAASLVDLHVSDLLNPQLPSHYDYTSLYDIMVFRRLATANAELPATPAGQSQTTVSRKGGPPVLRRIDTSPVGFAVFDRLLLTIHPADCAVREAYAAKLMAAAAPDARTTGVRLPTSPADLMLRVVNLMVDGYLELRRELTRQLDHWQAELLNPKTRFNNWGAMLETRTAMHHLDGICEDQRSAVQDWIDALQSWPAPETAQAQRERDMLQVRSRDVLEHIERVVHHVRRMEQSAETAVQIHFSLQGQRTNDIMRTLTVLTAVFLPLNFITGFFGMNFEFLPLIHSNTGLWWALGTMACVASLLGVFFWRKRYLSSR